jgi:hypothetical protein
MKADDLLPVQEMGDEALFKVLDGEHVKDYL